MPTHPRFRVRVAADGRPGSYEVLVGSGLLPDLAATVGTIVPAVRWVIVTDTTVAGLYGDTALGSFARQGVEADIVAFDPGEGSKTRETWARVCDRLVELGIGRDAGIVALGGGVVGDLAGFVAATYMRGLPLVQVPTTLLAMVDASVGGKTGIDVPAGKNLVGAFKWPAVVVTDPDVLRTLPEDVLRAGMAEAVKHAAIADAAHLSWLEERAEVLLTALSTAATAAAASEPLAELIRRSVEIKADVVSADPFESGRRAILNFGHTVAHALERHSDYGMSHGFAVAIGMVAEAHLGERLGVTEAGTTDRLTAVLSHLGLPVAIPEGFPADALIAHARLDKKNRRSGIRCSLIAKPGTPARSETGQWTVAVADADLHAALAALGADATTASRFSL